MKPQAHYYWDACVFIAYLNKEVSYGIYLEYIDQFLDDAKAGGCRIYTSTITLAEITKRHLVNSEIGSFEEFLDNFRSVIIPVDPNPSAMLKASHLRGMIYQKTGGTRKLATPDAINMATALTLIDTFGVPLDEFHTFDAGKNGGLPIIGYEEWCEPCRSDEMVKRVIDMKREKPTHPNPRLVK